MTKAFVTGATGFLGRSLIKRLIDEKRLEEIITLTRDLDKSSPLFSLAEKSKLRFILGDVRLNKLGLEDNDLQLVRDVEEVYHFVGEVSLANSSSESAVERIYGTNIIGTERVLDLFSKANIKRFYLCSTAYVGGSSISEVPEDYILEKIQFRNSYENSKNLAETVARKFSSFIPLTVVRPSILTLDYEEFDYVPNQSIYSYANVLFNALKRFPKTKRIALFGDESSQLNLIRKSDFFDIFLGIKDLENPNGIFNIVSNRGVNIDSIVESIGRGLDFEGFYLSSKIKYGDLNPTERFCFRFTSQFHPYMAHNNAFWHTSKTICLRKGNTLSENPEWFLKHIEQYARSLKDGKI